MCQELWKFYLIHCVYFLQHKGEIFLHFPNAFLSNNIASKNIFVRVEQCYSILAKEKAHYYILVEGKKASFVIKKEQKYSNYYTALSLIWLKLVTFKLSEVMKYTVCAHRRQKYCLLVPTFMTLIYLSMIQYKINHLKAISLKYFQKCWNENINLLEVACWMGFLYPRKMG